MKDLKMLLKWVLCQAKVKSEKQGTVKAEE